MLALHEIRSAASELSAAAPPAWFLSPGAGGADEPAAMRAAVDRFYRAYETLDLEQLAPLLADDVWLFDPTSALDVRGKAVFLEKFKNVGRSYTDTRFERTTEIFDGSRVAVQVVASGRFKRAVDGVETWLRYQVEGATFLGFSGGKVALWTDYFDTNGLRKQLGMRHF